MRFAKTPAFPPAPQMRSLPPVFIKSERCRPQEFSDEDAEEDIDALMSAHSKAASRRLSNAMSTVPPVFTVEMLGKACANTHTHAHLTSCMRCACSVVDFRAGGHFTSCAPSSQAFCVCCIDINQHGLECKEFNSMCNSIRFPYLN